MFFLGKQPVFVAKWGRETRKEGKGKLHNGDSVLIHYNQQGVEVSIIKNKITQKIYSCEAEAEFEKFTISVYEYDFDRDGENEIIIVDSPEPMIFMVYVYKNSSIDVCKKVGEFEGQIGVYLNKNRISLPVGSGGTGDEYLFINRAFEKVKFKSRFFFIDG